MVWYDLMMYNTVEDNTIHYNMCSYGILYFDIYIWCNVIHLKLIWCNKTSYKRYIYIYTYIILYTVHCLRTLFFKKYNSRFFEPSQRPFFSRSLTWWSWRAVAHCFPLRFVGLTHDLGYCADYGYFDRYLGDANSEGLHLAWGSESWMGWH